MPSVREVQNRVYDFVCFRHFGRSNCLKISTPIGGACGGGPVLVYLIKKTSIFICVFVAFACGHIPSARATESAAEQAIY